MMNSAEIRKLVANYFAQHLEDAEDSLADGIGVLGEDSEEDGTNDALDGLDRHLTDLVEDLARGKYQGGGKVADAILEGAGLTLDKESHEYRMLCRETLKGAIDATRVQLARMRGDYAPTPTTIQADGRTAVAQLLSLLPQSNCPKPPRICHGARCVSHWRPKTRKETEESSGYGQQGSGHGRADYKMIPFRDS
jgi:hypothetical protein